MGILISVFLPLGLAFIMFSLGLSLTLDDFKRVVARPFSFLVGAANQILLVPIVALALILLFSPPPELAVGIMILAFCPGGVTSNIISKLARGDVALSVSLTAVVSLSSILTVPFMVAWTVASFLGENAPPVTVVGLAVSMFLITTLPVALGVFIRHRATAFAERWLGFTGTLATLLFVIIVLAALASNWSLFVENLAVLGPILVALNVLLILLGLALPHLLGLSFDEVKTIAIETGIQNSTVGITLGAIVSGQTDGFSPFALPAAVYGITMYLVTIPVLTWLRTR